MLRTRKTNDRFFRLDTAMKRKGITLGHEDDAVLLRDVPMCGCGKRRAVPTSSGLRCIRCGQERDT